MQKESLRFANALDQVSFGDLGAIEQNIFFKILREIQRSGFEPITFTPTDIRNFAGRNLTLKEAADYSLGLRETLFKKDFTVIVDYVDSDGEEIRQTDYINIFKRLAVKTHRKTGDLLTVEVELNERFQFVLDKLYANFTVMELSEFLALRGKYSKTIFRLLCRFRGTGKAIFKWDYLKEQLKVPESYRMSEIDKRIFKPALEELRCDDMIRTLETDNERPIFKNLTMTKIKEKKRVVRIEFTWDVKPGERVIDAEPVKDEPQQVQEKTSAPPPAAASGPQPKERGPASPEVLELMDEAFNLLGRGVKVLR